MKDPRKRSTNLEDRTGNDEIQNFLTHLFTAINPLYAYRNTRESLLKNGVIDPPKRKIRWT